MERSDLTGDLVPSLVSEALRWLSESPQAPKDRDDKYMERVGAEGHVRTEHTRAEATRLLDLKLCFDLDARYQIPVGEKPAVVYNLMQAWVNRITNDAGKPTTLIGGESIAQDYKVPRAYVCSTCCHD